MIYLDNAATTKVFDSAVSAATDSMTNNYFNPNATYKCGVHSKNLIEKSRQTIANAVGAQPHEIIFTSGATESNNWVFNNGRKNTKGNVVVSAGEHSSVYECAVRLSNRGIDVRIVPLNKDGRIDLEAFKRTVDGNTALVSIIHVSNETGVINPIGELSAITKKIAPKALFHSDGVQAILKTSTNISGLGCDFYSASAHKIGAPKGIGFLYVKRGINISPMLCGGGQESGLRSGTQNTPYIAAFAAAVKQFQAISHPEYIHNLRSKLVDYFTENGCQLIGDTDNNSDYILCVHVPHVKAEILQNAVYEEGVVIGKGAACSGSKRGNRVLSAMGLSDTQVECCIRLSVFADTKTEDAMSAAQLIIKTADKIRSNHVG